MTERPAGQPGEVSQGKLRVRQSGERFGLSYPAVRDDAGVVFYWRDTESATAHWMVAPARLAESFIPGEEWQADCDHAHSVPWRTCDTEVDCLSLRREEEWTWGR
ncbi:hypothetical protein [Terrabacter sp. NPDC000476]|uniref:hypothetical protein n=1 Tax=Terrabacter sp. NPDC000476 TaxID=3154258 RepID=UPI00331B4BDF